jgi:hypothetical protein
MLYLKGEIFPTSRRRLPVHPIQLELDHMVDAGLPGAFAFIEKINGASQFFTAGFGDLATLRRMMPESRYRIGSTTKTFTICTWKAGVLPSSCSMEPVDSE